MSSLKLRIPVKFLLLTVLLLLSLTVIIPSTVAHERRAVGDYQLVFGWRVEPAVANVLNGPELYIRLPEGSTMTEDDIAALEVSLQTEVSFGPASRTLNLRAAFGETGHYIADMIPTRPGDYSFRVFGTIGDLAVDEVFTSADGSFSGVEPSSDLQFPEADPTASELLARIEALEAEVAALKGE
jgi:hypothetical protein